MPIAELITALRNRDAGLYVDGAGTLRYLGPRLASGDPIRQAIAEHRAMLVELFTYAPGGRCITVGCYRLKADDAATCPGPHFQLDDASALSEAHRVGQEAA